jgi:glyoxalase family protein
MALTRAQSGLLRRGLLMRSFVTFVGSGHVTAITFAVPSRSLAYWRSRLSSHGVSVNHSDERFSETVLAISDPAGLPLELVASPLADPASAWKDAPVDREHAICGFHSATLSEEGYEQTARLLTDTMEFSLVGNEGNRFRYQATGGGSGALVDVLCTLARAVRDRHRSARVCDRRTP